MTALAAAALVAVIWWPNGDYRPIQPGEKGTLASGVHSLKDIGTGRPALTAQRAAELKGAPGKSARLATTKEQTSQPKGAAGDRSKQAPAKNKSGDQTQEPQDQVHEPSRTAPEQQQQQTAPSGTQTPPPDQQQAPSGTPPQQGPAPPTSTTP